MSFVLALNLLDFAVESGGGTFTSDGKPFTGSTGYVVGGKVPPLVMGVTVGGFGLAEVKSVAAWIDANPSQFYGSWDDGGTVYIDAVDIIEDWSEAITAGTKRGELAIWDLSREEEVRL